MLVFVRSLEAQARRTDLFRDMDRAGYLLARTLEITGPLSINTLAEALHLDATTVTRQVATMADSGFVARGADPHDRRVRTVALTAKGRRVMDTVRRERRTRSIVCSPISTPPTVKSSVDCSSASTTRSPEATADYARARDARVGSVDGPHARVDLAADGYETEPVGRARRGNVVGPRAPLRDKARFDAVIRGRAPDRGGQPAPPRGWRRGTRRCGRTSCPSNARWSSRRSCRRRSWRSVAIRARPSPLHPTRPRRPCRAGAPASYRRCRWSPHPSSARGTVSPRRRTRGAPRRRPPRSRPRAHRPTRRP